MTEAEVILRLALYYIKNELTTEDVSVSIDGAHVTDNGWIGPDHPKKATVEWGQEMLQTCADYIVDFAEEFKKVDLEKVIHNNVLGK